MSVFDDLYPLLFCRSRRDINDNHSQPADVGQDATGKRELMSHGGNTAVTYTSNTSSLSYAEIDGPPQVPMMTNGIQHHKDNVVGKNGITQHELTYNDDQVIPSTATCKEGSTSYEEIDDSPSTARKSKQGQPESNMVNSNSYAEIDESQVNRNPQAGRIPRPNLPLSNVDNKQAPPLSMINSASYAEIEENQMLGKTNQGKSAIPSSASYAEIQDPHAVTKLPKESVASYISFQAEGQKSPESDTSEGEVFYDNPNLIRSKSSWQSGSEQSNKRPVSELPTITESEETAQASRRHSSVGTVDNIIYEGGDSS